jgi:hypothetical protein
MKTLLTAALCFTLAADDVARHKEWMDQAQDLKDDLKDALDAKTWPKAASCAEELAKTAQRSREAGQRESGSLQANLGSRKKRQFRQSAAGVFQTRSHVPRMSRSSPGKTPDPAPINCGAGNAT